MDDCVRPVARHRDLPARLLLRDGEDRWLVWLADRPDRWPEEIADETASWLLSTGWVEPLPIDCAWVDAADLPLSGDASTRLPNP